MATDALSAAGGRASVLEEAVSDVEKSLADAQAELSHVRTDLEDALNTLVDKEAGFCVVQAELEYR